MAKAVWFFFHCLQKEIINNIMNWYSYHLRQYS